MSAFVGEDVQPARVIVVGMHVGAPANQPQPAREPCASIWLEAPCFGGLLVFVMSAWPSLRTRATGLDAPAAQECWLAVGMLGLGFLLGRALLRSRLSLLVAGLGVATASVVIALSRGLGLAQPGDLGLALPLAATTGVALGTLVPGFGRRRRWLALMATAVGAVAVVAILHFGGAALPHLMVSALLVLAPPVVMLVAVGRTAKRPSVVGLWAALPAPATALAAGALALTFVPVPPLPGGSGMVGLPRLTRLAHNGDAEAIHDRATQEMQLWYRGVLVDAEGPLRPQSPFVATLLAAVVNPGDRVLVLGAGVGRLPEALQRAGVETFDVIDWRTQAGPLYGRLGNVGPVADPVGTEASPWIAKAITNRGCLETLARLPDAARQAIVIAEPLHVGVRWQAEVESQAELRRVAGSGLIVQPFAMDRVPPAMLSDVLVAAAKVHAWNGVLAVGDCAVLLSSAAEPRWPQPASFDHWSSAARWQAHAAHLGEPDDLKRTWLGTVRLPADGSDAESHVVDESAITAAATVGSAGRRATLRVLHAGLRPAPAMLPARSSLLLWWVDVRSRISVAERAIRLASADTGARVRRSTFPFLPLGSPSALLQGALALADETGVRFRSADASSLAAFAIDPTFFATRPAVLAELPAPKHRHGDLEDLAALPRDDRLVELCSGDSAFAIALRVRFPSACARVLVEKLKNGVLTKPQAEALRHLADPFVLERAGRALSERQAIGELLGLWRGDLAMPKALEPLVRAPVADRIALAAALGGRRDAVAMAALAELLVDQVLDVRSAAADSLLATAGNRIAYDPKWSRSKRFLAAEQVRALHNRAP